MLSERNEISTPTAAVEAHSEVQEYLTTSQQRRRLFPRSALVGLCAGLIAIIFRTLLVWADTLRNGLVVWSQQYERWGWLFPVLFGATCAALSVFVVRRYAPEASGSGIPHLKATLHRLRELRWWRVLPV